MAAAITVESLDSVKALVDEEDALVTYRRLADEAGFDGKIPTFLVSTLGCRMLIILIMTLVVMMTLEDLDTVSEVQVDEQSIHSIADLDMPLVMGDRPKELSKAIQEKAKDSWDRKRRGSVEDKDVPLPSEEMKRLEALLLCKYSLRIPADEDAGETVASRLKRQLNKHRIRFEDILKIETLKVETAETRIRRTKLGNKTELVEREEPEHRQLKTITTEVYLDALWTDILGLARAGVEELQYKPSAAETDESQSYDYVHIPLTVTINYHCRAKRFAASLPKDLAIAILKEIDEAERMMWTEGVRGPKAGMVTHQIMMEQAHAWAWHDKSGEGQPTEPTQPPPASRFRGQPDFAPNAMGTWTAKNKGGRALCQAYQQNQCASNSCSMGAHGCAMVARESGHVCGTEHPAYKRRWGEKPAKQVGREDSREDER